MQPPAPISSSVENQVEPGETGEGVPAPRGYWLCELLFFMIGLTSGLCFVRNLLPFIAEDAEPFSRGYLATLFVSSALAFTVLLFCLRFAARALVAWSSLPASVKDRYGRYDSLCYAPFLIFCLGSVGVTFPLSTAPALLTVSCVLAQAILLYCLLDAPQRVRAFASFRWLSFLFFLSGFAALIYQIVWQRVLFGLFGVNIESVTITVSLFMFGLGIGSLVGGVLSRRFPEHAPQLFFLCELAIGLFGLFSIPLIEQVGEATLHGSQLSVSLATYALLSLPTMGMGATLPILVGYLNRYYANVGKSVGVLYFINTLGSAVACFITADILFVFFGMQTAVLVAAACNFIVAVLVFRYCRRLARKTDAAGNGSTAAGVVPKPAYAPALRSEFVVALLLALATGYISLSQEILWFRAISYITAGKPDVFAYVLGFFLFGVAFGALLAKRVCEAGKQFAIPFIVLMLALSGICYYLSLPWSAFVMTLSDTLGLGACYLAVTVIAFLLGSVFPVVCHYGIQGRQTTGFWLSLVYFVNILGATAGPLLTGFFLLEYFPLDQNFFFVSALILGLAGVLGLVYFRQLRSRLAVGAGAAYAIVVLLLTQDGLYAQVLEKLHYKSEYPQIKVQYPAWVSYKYVVQNRSGIIAVEAGETDVVYGGGIYDGRFNLDPVSDGNGIRRAYMIAALHPQPADVLEIGLSSGSWSRVLADHEGVKKMTIVEINPGYLGLIEKYPMVASLFDDPRITIHIDDGRRWLRRNPDKKFDFILMNSSYHWRDHSTNVLSVEFLRLCKAHLKPGGVIYYNTTYSDDVEYTAACVFQHVTRYENFVAASDSPFDMTPQERWANLLRYRHDGKLVFDPAKPRLNMLLRQLASSSIPERAPGLLNRKDLWRITDDNMATEFKSIDNGANSWERKLADRLFGPRHR